MQCSLVGPIARCDAQSGGNLNYGSINLSFMRCFDDVGETHNFVRFEGAFEFHNDVYPVNENRPFMWKLYDQDTCQSGRTVVLLLQTLLLTKNNLSIQKISCIKQFNLKSLGPFLSGNFLTDLDLAWRMNSRSVEMRYVTDLSITYGRLNIKNVITNI